MNLAQMQMAYSQAPNGKTVLKAASPQIKFSNGHNHHVPRIAQGQNRARKSGSTYRALGFRPRHDCEWK